MKVFAIEIIFPVFTVDWVVLHHVCAAFGQQRELRNIPESSLHRWHCAAAYHSRECRPVCSKCLPGRRLLAPNCARRRLHDSRRVSHVDSACCSETWSSEQPAAVPRQNHSEGYFRHVRSDNNFILDRFVTLS